MPPPNLVWPEAYRCFPIRLCVRPYTTVHASRDIVNTIFLQSIWHIFTKLTDIHIFLSRCHCVVIECRFSFDNKWWNKNSIFKTKSNVLHWNSETNNESFWLPVTRARVHRIPWTAAWQSPYSGTIAEWMYFNAACKSTLNVTEG